MALCSSMFSFSQQLFHSPIVLQSSYNYDDTVVSCGDITRLFLLCADWRRGVASFGCPPPNTPVILNETMIGYQLISGCCINDSVELMSMAARSKPNIMNTYGGELHVAHTS